MVSGAESPSRSRGERVNSLSVSLERMMSDWSGIVLAALVFILGMCVGISISYQFFMSSWERILAKTKRQLEEAIEKDRA